MELTRLGVRSYSSHSIDVIEVSGEVDVLNVAELHPLVLSVTSSSDNLVIDLRGVSYIDSAGLELMINVYTRQRARNKPFAILTKKQSQPEDVLRIVGFGSITKVTSDAAELGLE